MEPPTDAETDVPKKKKRRFEQPVVVKNASDYQRMKLERLMSNPDKPVVIPDRPKAKNFPTPSEFNRNVMGSSAGAGSGEFHVYRHIRRREVARMEMMEEQYSKEMKDEEYQRKLEENRIRAEEKTAKKRQKRLKKKANKKKGGKIKKPTSNDAPRDSETSDDEPDKEAEGTTGDDRKESTSD